MGTYIESLWDQVIVVFEVLLNGNHKFESIFEDPVL